MKNLPATKSDLDKLEKKLVEKLATKNELNTAVAKLDAKIEQTESVLRDEIRFTAEETKEEIREEIKQSSSRILNTLDSFLAEMKTSEEERTISAHQLRNHDERITVLEQTAGIAVA